MPVRNFTTLGDPSGLIGSTHAVGINGAGQIVGNFQDKATSGIYGFFYSGGTYTTLKASSTAFTFATGINHAGQIVGYYLQHSRLPI